MNLTKEQQAEVDAYNKAAEERDEQMRQRHINPLLLISGVNQRKIPRGAARHILECEKCSKLVTAMTGKLLSKPLLERLASFPVGMSRIEDIPHVVPDQFRIDNAWIAEWDARHVIGRCGNDDNCPENHQVCEVCRAIIVAAIPDCKDHPDIAEVVEYLNQTDEKRDAMTTEQRLHMRGILLHGMFCRECNDAAKAFHEMGGVPTPSSIN